MKQEELENWFGDRGYPLKSGRKKYRVVTKNEKQWVFIPDKYYLGYNESYGEIELYYLNTNIAEPYDGWDEKTFDWSHHNLYRLIPEDEADD